MKMSEIKEMTQAELLAKGRDLRAELFNLKLQKASSQLEKPSRLTNLRHDVSRIETQLSVLRKQEQSGS